MNQQQRRIVSAAVLVIVLSLFGKVYSDMYRASSEDYQNLYLAIGLSFAGIAIHFLKNYRDTKKPIKMWLESLELLMLIMTPVAVSYKILKDTYPHNIWAIIIPTILVLGSWYVVSSIRSNRIGEEIDGKPTFSFAIFFFFAIVVGMIPFILFAMQQ